MGKILCECGYLHSDTCGYDGYLFKEAEMNVSDEERENLNPLSVLECPKCGNLMIDDPNDCKKMITYKPYNNKYNKLLHDLLQ
jgi:predicted RNA-binding Zn-ribbon protein involved in translation (DUF1610 family)